MANSDNKITISSQWKSLSEAHVSIGGQWKTLSEGYVSVSGQWEQWWGSEAPVGGNLWSWGRNNYGQLGFGTVATNYSSPVQVGSDTDWASVGVGGYHSAAIKTDGSLWMWGRNDYGQLGLGDRNHRSSPVQVGSGTNWSRVSCNLYSTIALKTDGTLWAWGQNTGGELGLNDINTGRSSPVQIGSLTTWEWFSSGSHTTIAIRNDGTMWSWGTNDSGQLGTGTFQINASSPVQIGSSTDWAFVVVASSAAAVKDDGHLWTWGSNSTGELGLGTCCVDSSLPAQVGSLTDWSTLAISGDEGVLAIKTDGSLWSWGSNTDGQLGDGTTNKRSSPVQVGGLTNWAQISADYNGAILAIKNDGTLWSWGHNNYGQLGLGDVTSRSSPVQIGSNTNWANIDISNSGEYHQLAITI